MKFDSKQFQSHGGYLTYGTKFVARHKYGGSAGFKQFLVKNFTVEEYFGRLEAGESPLPILESKGFVSANTRKVLRAMGYPETQEGKAAYLADQVKRYFASKAA